MFFETFLNFPKNQLPHCHLQWTVLENHIFIAFQYYGAFILNWWFSRLNSWRDCVVITRDFAIHGSNSYIRFTGKMPDLLILKLTFSLMDCMRNLPIIIYIKPPIQNYSLLICSLSKIIAHLVKAIANIDMKSINTGQMRLICK